MVFIYPGQGVGEGVLEPLKQCEHMPAAKQSIPGRHSGAGEKSRDVCVDPVPTL